ncbi:hypothetical protein [Streptomyces umbrinus]|uniref:hypothetical protein n=1 Tax=Streptomyces umbrinus TaxID=67370 RepID=UPI00340EF781
MRRHRVPGAQSAAGYGRHAPSGAPKLSDPAFRWAVTFMYFIDSNGNDWTRTSTGLDERAPLPKTTLENPIGQGIGNIAVFEEQVGEAGLCEGRGK